LWPVEETPCSKILSEFGYRNNAGRNEACLNTVKKESRNKVETCQMVYVGVGWGGRWFWVIWCLNTAKNVSRTKVETCYMVYVRLGQVVQRRIWLVLDNLASKHREEGIARKSRNRLDGLCYVGLGMITLCVVGCG